MTVRECYEKIGDYDRMYTCFHDDAKILKFLKMFLADENYEKLSSALDENDTDAAFAAAHTLKGVCQNLALDDLYDADVQVTEALRAKDIVRAKELFPNLKKEYENTVSAIEGIN